MVRSAREDRVGVAPPAGVRRVQHPVLDQGGPAGQADRPGARREFARALHIGVRSGATIDGGGITAPCLAFYNLKGEWDVENIGISPDIEVEYTPADVIKGHDPQLERAVKEALRLLEQNPVKRVPRPAPIDRVSKAPEKAQTTKNK